MTAAIKIIGLGKRYRRVWALRDCNLDVPQGRIVALVGPNGAGKTTMLHLASGLLRPTRGEVRSLGADPARDPHLLPRIGFVAQDVPLYRSFSVQDTMDLGRHLNQRWDDALARHRIERLGISSGTRIGELSGGQRAQVSLALVLAKRPELLLLDEPLASLDPLARRELLGALMEDVAEQGITVVLSSHLVSDLERVCDYLIVLSSSKVKVSGQIDELLNTHSTISGPRRDAAAIAGVESVIGRAGTDRQTTMFVRTSGPILDPSWVVQPPDLEELVMAYLGQPDASLLPPPRLIDSQKEVSR